MCEDTFQVVVLDLATVGEVTGTWMKIDNGIYGMIDQVKIGLTVPKGRSSSDTHYLTPLHSTFIHRPVKRYVKHFQAKNRINEQDVLDVSSE